VCWPGSDDSETTTSTSSVSCSHRWIVHPKTHAHGARRISAAPTQQQCLEACVDDSSCIAVDFGGGCWMHDEQRQRNGHNSVTQFEIVRQCKLVNFQNVTSLHVSRSNNRCVFYYCWYRRKNKTFSRPPGRVVPGGLMFYCWCFYLFLPRDLWALSDDRR